MNQPTEKRLRRVYEPGEIAAAKRLYLQLGPNRIPSLIREMRAQGFLRFITRDLRPAGEVPYIGLEEAHGWYEEWARSQPVTTVKAKGTTTRVGTATKAEGIVSPGAHSTSPSAEKVTEPTALDLPAWLKATAPTLTWTWRYQTAIYHALERVTNGRQRRMMLFLPPRHGKSELVSVRYAAWRLLRDPRLRIVIASYSQKLANYLSRRVRSLYSDLQLARENDQESPLLVKAAVEWQTSDGGGVKAVGVGSGITGFGADLIIIDDPVKGRAEAESANTRERIWEWYTDDLMTRLEPKGSVILIQTRWHDDDLAGRLLKRQASLESGVVSLESGSEKRRKRTRDSDHWSVVSLPALAEDDDPLGRKPGQPLCSKRFSLKALLKKKQEMGAYSFAALYQQSPIPNEGALFKREWFSRIVDAAPKGLRWARGYDLAVSTKTSADFTASFRVALDKKTGDLYIADGFRRRIEFPEQRRYIVGRIRDERDTEHGIEEALHGQAFVQELWREERLSASAFRGIRPSGDKYTRALTWANRAEAGKVVLVRGGWIDDLLEEACRFPYGAHDDQIDAISLAVQMLEKQKKKFHAF